MEYTATEREKYACNHRTDWRLVCTYKIDSQIATMAAGSRRPSLQSGAIRWQQGGAIRFVFLFVCYFVFLFCSFGCRLSFHVRVIKLQSSLVTARTASLAVGYCTRYETHHSPSFMRSSNVRTHGFDSAHSSGTIACSTYSMCCDRTGATTYDTHASCTARTSLVSRLLLLANCLQVCHARGGHRCASTSAPHCS